uniref:Uncharacterized protein n=1 Tax=Mola mola TaxID=94237 RepID=A0A3Q3XHN1_MOLML
MYTITRGPSKLVTQRRTGPTQQVESKFSDLKLKPTSWLSSDSPPPKIVFNRPNGKRYHGAGAQKAAGPAEGFTPAHEENVRFVSEAWQEVEQQLGDGDGGDSSDSQGPIQYTEKTPSAAMKSEYLPPLDPFIHSSVSQHNKANTRHYSQLYHNPTHNLLPAALLSEL